ENSKKRILKKVTSRATWGRRQTNFVLSYFRVFVIHTAFSWRLEVRMPHLSYRCTEDNGLSFELLVDGDPLGDLIGSSDTMFPYWIVEDGLPRWPPHGPPDAPE